MKTLYACVEPGKVVLKEKELTQPGPGEVFLYITEKTIKLPTEPFVDIGLAVMDVGKEFKHSPPDFINTVKESITNHCFLEPLP